MSPRQAINVWFECHGAPRDSENELPPKRPPKELKELMRASSVPGSLVLLAPSTRSVVQSSPPIKKTGILSLP